MRVLVTRPEPHASAIAVRLQALGHQVFVAPLLSVESVAWAVPTARPDAVIMTSGNAARHGGQGLATLRHLPLFAVGQATAAAARAAGFANVTHGETGVADLLAQAATRGVRHVLHLAGEDRIDAAVPPGMQLDIVTVYRAVAATALPVDAATALDVGAIDVALLFSPRTARILAGLCTAPAGLAIAALSPAVLAAAGPGWRSAVAAEQPTEAALLAAAGLTCKKPSAED